MFCSSSYIETTDVIRNFLTENVILHSIQKRVNENLTLQWKTNEGFQIMYNKTVIHDAPMKLLTEINYAKYKSYFLTVPLFQVCRYIVLN